MEFDKILKTSILIRYLVACLIFFGPSWLVLAEETASQKTEKVDQSEENPAEETRDNKTVENEEAKEENEKSIDLPEEIAGKGRFNVVLSVGKKDKLYRGDEVFYLGEDGKADGIVFLERVEKDYALGKMISFHKKAQIGNPLKVPPRLGLVLQPFFKVHLPFKLGGEILAPGEESGVFPEELEMSAGMKFVYSRFFSHIRPFLAFEVPWGLARNLGIHVFGGPELNWIIGRWQFNPAISIGYDFLASRMSLAFNPAVQFRLNERFWIYCEGGLFNWIALSQYDDQDQSSISASLGAALKL